MHLSFLLSTLIVLSTTLATFNCRASNIHLSVLKKPSVAFIDGSKRLVYELVLKNQGTTSIKLKHININGASFGRLRLDENQLKPKFKLLGTVDLDTISDWLVMRGTPQTMDEPNVIPVGRTALVFLELSTNLKVKIPSKINHQIKIESGVPSLITKLNYTVSVDQSKPLVISSPFSGGLWYPANAPSDLSPHRRSVLRLHGDYYIGQRFAIDWMKIGEDGRVLFPAASSKENASYYGYGTPVYAVANAKVSRIIDDLPENISDARAVTINLQTVGGNTVILDLGNSNYALYAHLQPGSIKVKEGDQVHNGQVLGLLGNSGNSTGPHLHFHICDGPSALECQGIPYVIEEFNHQEIKAEGDDLEQLHFSATGTNKKVKRELIWNEQQISFPVK